MPGFAGHFDFYKFDQEELKLRTGNTLVIRWSFNKDDREFGTAT